MTNNDILRRIRYILDYNDHQMLAITRKAAPDTSLKQINSWLKKEDDKGYQACQDSHLAAFLNGLIIEQRGPRGEDLPSNEQSLNNNLILRKLKIAFHLQSDEILDILELAELSISAHELSALFRRPDHKHYRQCKDQILRNFLMGLQLQRRGDLKPSNVKPANKKSANKKTGNKQSDKKPPQSFQWNWKPDAK
ncbi:MAG: DUF1456 family protein [Candidatus Pelagadaptatus aseana]|uniref:DUF1456 family protein n=1 Tax=Candidatus Pelagadaptatus aseana TaxID=3120508 RepID=UPI0039B2DD40